MPGPRAKAFRAKLEATGTSLHWVVARIPVDLKKAWPEWKTRRMRGEINGFAFATTLFSGPKGQGLTLLVNKKMQAGGKARAGETAQIKLEPDLEVRTHPMSTALADELKGDRALQKWFEKISPSMRKGISSLVDDAKSVETRKRRARRMAETLLLTMEGELETPPILRVAFQRQPLALEGWKAMTPRQRRSQLFGIFYQQTVDSRERRAAKTVEEAIRVARKRAEA